MDLVIYEINLNEAREIAEHRMSVKHQRPGVHAQTHSALNAHIMGAMGELAFEAWSGIPLDREWKESGAISDDGRDFVFPYQGREVVIDVKARTNPKEFLVFKRDLEHATDIFVCVSCKVPGLNPNNVIINGFVKKRDLARCQEAQSLCKGHINKVCPMTSLRDLSDLYGWIKQGTLAI